MKFVDIVGTVVRDNIDTVRSLDEASPWCRLGRAVELVWDYSIRDSKSGGAAVRPTEAERDSVEFLLVRYLSFGSNSGPNSDFAVGVLLAAYATGYEDLS